MDGCCPQVLSDLPRSVSAANQQMFNSSWLLGMYGTKDFTSTFNIVFLAKTKPKNVSTFSWTNTQFILQDLKENTKQRCTLKKHITTVNQLKTWMYNSYTWVARTHKFSFWAVMWLGKHGKPFENLFDILDIKCHFPALFGHFGPLVHN